MIFTTAAYIAIIVELISQEMKNTTLLVIEGRHAEIPSFAADLQKKGFDVVTVQNGSQAVSKLKQTESKSGCGQCSHH